MPKDRLFVVEEDEPYELWLKYRGQPIAKFNLDDAPVEDWNRAIRRLAHRIEEVLNERVTIQMLLKDGD